MSPTATSPSPRAAHLHHAALHHDPQAAANAVAALEESRLRELAARQRWRARAWVVARVLLGAVFIAGAVAKATTFSATEGAMSDFGFQLTGLLLTFAIAIEAIAGALVVVGFKARGAALALATWVLTLTMLVHGNLGIEANRVAWFTNTAMIAALLFLFAHGAGALSFDQRQARREAQL